MNYNNLIQEAGVCAASIRDDWQVGDAALHPFASLPKAFKHSQNKDLKIQIW